MIITLEGLDGAGKATQTNLLIAYLESRNITVNQMSFPQYKETIHGTIVSKYLNGEFGDPVKVHPLLASVLFAQDRVDSKPKLEKLISKAGVTVLDRYVLSNAAYQAAKIIRKNKREEFYAFIHEYEHQFLKLPKPEIVVYLKVNANKAHENIGKKGKRAYTKVKRDGHESNLKYLKKVAFCYEELFKIAPNFFEHLIVIECNEPNGRLRSVDSINKEIVSEVDKILDNNEELVVEGLFKEDDQDHPYFSKTTDFIL